MCVLQDPKMKEGFYQLELNKTIWEVAERYTNLAPVGSGAYGQVGACLKTSASFSFLHPRLYIKYMHDITCERLKNIHFISWYDRPYNCK